MPKNIASLLMIGGLVIVGLICLFLLISRLDPKNSQLKTAPGYTLIYPQGDLIATSSSQSVLGAGADITRSYGVKTSDEEIRNYFEKELTALGYQQTDEKGDQYSKGPFQFQLSYAPTGTRVGGKTWVNSDYRILLTTKLDNIPH